MKQKIEPADIRKGDLIRWELGGPKRGYNVAAVEYLASYERAPWRLHDGTHYLLHRPEPPFEPRWGMVLRHPNSAEERAVYLPLWERDSVPWLVYTFEEHGWMPTGWGEQKIKEGWFVEEKPEGVN